MVGFGVRPAESAMAATGKTPTATTVAAATAKSRLYRVFMEFTFRVGGADAPTFGRPRVAHIGHLTVSQTTPERPSVR
ncbi:hypothetical protein GCM10010404_92170 [Nonomuraea africana]